MDDETEALMKLVNVTLEKTYEAMGLTPEEDEEIDLHEENPGMGSF